MIIAIVHNHVNLQAAPDARDVLAQAQAIAESLTRLGHTPRLFSCDLNLAAVKKDLQTAKPDLVFNLVEDLDGQGRLIHLFPFLLDTMGLRYTGSPAEVLLLSSHKTMAKEIMERNALPTPQWNGPWPGTAPGEKDLPSRTGQKRWIIKSVWEHASLGLDGDSIVTVDSSEHLWAELRSRCSRLGGACFAEEFIDGREFNLSLIATQDGVEVLPPAEIVFTDYPTGMAKIVDYQAKWAEETFAYQNTNRRFEFGGEDDLLLVQLRQIAHRCWQTFGLSGYARVDFRVDLSGNPTILEVNANPCLSPDAGFIAAAERAGLGFDQVISRIIAESDQVGP
ncbi:MAG: D-alanine--D-alanine ligase [Proteobacteria bacterium]|nr:D-alanine--D-alanine ligase [Pseudomonadota bacterium]MBU1687354.1 D-alanine--D-alanine ligase [Pseudomonadota bacterium]